MDYLRCLKGLFWRLTFAASAVGAVAVDVAALVSFSLPASSLLPLLFFFFLFFVSVLGFGFLRCPLRQNASSIEFYWNSAIVWKARWLNIQSKRLIFEAEINARWLNSPLLCINKFSFLFCCSKCLCDWRSVEIYGRRGNDNARENRKWNERFFLPTERMYLCLLHVCVCVCVLSVAPLLCIVCVCVSARASCSHVFRPILSETISHHHEQPIRGAHKSVYTLAHNNTPHTRTHTYTAAYTLARSHSPHKYCTCAGRTTGE